MAFFEEIKKNFGFGCMRLPMKNGEVDLEEFSRMVDYFIDNGFNYFDTAHGYIEGKSERAIKECLAKRHKREEFLLTDKLSDNFFNSREEIRPLVEAQLEACGVEYFDFFLMHAQGHWNYDKYVKTQAYQEAFELKKAGLVRHVGLSFHDNAEMLDRILTENPEIEIVQIQFNYLDYEDPGVQSRKCLEVCEKHGKPVLVMEPVRGGRLANLPKPAAEIFAKLGDMTPASYALRFVGGFKQICMILSGMSNMEQMIDNVSFMKDFEPLNEEELEAVWKVNEILHNQDIVNCTGCRYCIERCPMNIQIADIFAAMNEKVLNPSGNADAMYEDAVERAVSPTQCLKCGACEGACPQRIAIREKLDIALDTFE